MKILKNYGIAAVQGILCLGENIGIKKDKKDFAAIYSTKPANAAGMFTTNKVKGAPVIVSAKKLEGGKAQAIVINSGISNVCTGKKGIEDAEETANLASKELGISKSLVLVSSTGLIGAYLPMNKIKDGIKGIKKKLGKDSLAAAQAIMTTDLNPKMIAVKEGDITIGGIAKGSGMINPNMATMLAFIATDAEIDSKVLKASLKKAVDKSFNMITVDNDTSTSDSVILLANGMAGKVSMEKFQTALEFVCTELAKMIARDGEGATKLIHVKVKNAKTEKQAKAIAKSVAGSNLCKAAMYGNDPNWGRILCAAGYSGAELNPEKVDIYVDKEIIVSEGTGTGFDKEKVSALLRNDPVVITIDLNSGDKEADAYGCDLTYEYVKINAQYHT